MLTPNAPTDPIRRRVRAWLAALLAALSLAVAHGAAAQADYSQAELDRMLAPIALYPDALLSQILMAATYPVEVVEAARWSRAHPALQGDAAVRAVEDEDWDPSVKSLVAFPGVLARMDEDLGWTRQLGDAFLDQEAQVMVTVQALRRRARAAGTLASDARIRVADYGGTLAVESVDPTVVYVPYYDPRVAYGPWWWPAYPPVFWAPWPGYAVHYPAPRPGIAVGFFWGPAVRVSVGFFFGAIDWPRREVKVVSVTNYYYYRPVIVRRSVEVHQHVVVTSPGPWRHDSLHRRGVAYRTPEAQRRYVPAPSREVRRSPEPRQVAAPARPEPRALVEPAPATRTEQGGASRGTRAEARRDVSPSDRRVELRQSGTVAPPPAAPATAPHPQPGAAPSPANEPSRERGQDRTRTTTAAPGAATPPDVDAASNRRDSRGARDVRDRGSVRDAGNGEARADRSSQQNRRADAPGGQRGSDNEQSPRAQSQPAGAQVEQQRRPPRRGDQAPAPQS